MKLLLVSRWPLAKISWLPRPALVPEPLRKSALTPGAREGELREAAGSERCIFDQFASRGCSRWSCRSGCSRGVPVTVTVVADFAGLQARR